MKLINQKFLVDFVRIDEEGKTYILREPTLIFRTEKGYEFWGYILSLGNDGATRIYGEMEEVALSKLPAKICVKITKMENVVFIKKLLENTFEFIKEEE